MTDANDNLREIMRELAKGKYRMTAATKKEAQLILNAARTKAQNAMMMKAHAGDEIERDTAEAHYRRCISELEEAINDMARFETGDDE